MIALVNQLAAQLRKLNANETRSTSMRKAWATIKAAGKAAVITFKTVKDEIKRRVVCCDWQQFYTPTGTGKPTPAGLQLFADLAKVAAGVQNPIISAYQSNIISIN